MSGPSPKTTADLRQRAASGVVTVVIRGFAIRSIGFLATLALARLLAPSDFGYLTLGLSLVMIGQFLATGGLGVALIGQREEPTPRQLGAVLGFQLLAAAAVVVVLGGLASFFGKGGTIAAIMLLALPFDAARAPKAIVLERQLSYRGLARAEVAETLAYGILAVSSVALGAGVWGVAAATVGRAIIALGLFIGLAPFGLPRPLLALDEVRRIWRFGASFQAVQFGTLARDFGYNAGLGVIAGVGVVGLWGFAIRLLQPILLVIMSLYRVSFPATAQLAGAGADTAASLVRALNLANLVMGATLVAIATASAPLVPVVFGTAWTDAVPVIFLVCVALMINGAVSGCATGYLLALGDATTIVRATVAHTVALYAVTFPLLDGLDAVAVGCGAIASSTADLVVLGRAVKRHTGVPAIRQALPTIFAGVTGASAGVVVGSTIGNPVLAAAAALGVGQLLFVSVLVLLQKSAVLEALRTGRRLLRRDPAVESGSPHGSTAVSRQP